MPAYFDSSIAEFLTSSRDAILAALARGTGDDGHDLLPTQTRAWEKQCDALKAVE